MGRTGSGYPSSRGKHRKKARIHEMLMRTLARRGVRRSSLRTMIRKRSMLIANNIATPTDTNIHNNAANTRHRAGPNNQVVVTIVIRLKGMVVSASIMSESARLANRKLIAERMAARRYTITHTAEFPISAKTHKHTISIPKNTCTGTLTSFTSCTTSCPADVTNNIRSTNEVPFCSQREETFSILSDWLRGENGQGRAELSFLIAKNTPEGEPWQPPFHLRLQEVPAQETGNESIITKRNCNQ